MAEDNTPTNVVDVGNVHDNPNYKVSLNVDNNGNVIIYRSTNTPDRFSDTDFSKFEINKTIGEQTYFASNPEFAQSFSQSGKRNIYSFSTNIKPEEILHLQSNIYENKELLNKLGGQEYINNIVNERGINNYRFNSLDNIPKSLTWSELYYSTNKGRTDGSKEILQREIVELQNNGVKAIGVSPVSGAKNEYNILPIINEQSQLDIVAKGLIDKNLKETSLDTPTNVVDDVVVTRGLSNAEMAIPTNADGNIILYRATTDPNISIVSDFTDIGKAGQAGLGKQNYFAIDEMYAYLYSRPSINKNVYKFETNIKANQVLNLQSPTAKQLEVLSKIGINEEDLKNWYMQIKGQSKVNTAIQNNLDYLLDNDIKAIGNNLTGPTANVFEYEIVPIITEKTTTEIKPVSQLILDPKWEGTDRILNVENELFQSKQSTQYADKYLPTDVNNKDTKYRPVYYVDEEGIGRREKTFQFSEQPLENNLVRDNLIEVPTDTPTNVELVKDTYVISTDTPTNVVGNEFVDNIVNANTQLVNDLPLSETVKNQFDNVVRNRAKNLATPGGVIDAVDVWEIGVLGLMITAIAYKEFDEIPTIFKRTATNMFNSMTSMYNIPPVPLEQYDLDYEFIEKVITTGEKVMPTDIIIKKVGDVVKGVAETGMVTGFGYVPPNPTKTDTMETTQTIQPGVQEEKMFKKAKPQKGSGAGSGVKIL
jgi:hypothetical protein